jgi:AcrR family transcriptional regulator
MLRFSMAERFTLIVQPQIRYRQICMKKKQRTQAERSAGTREALIAAGRSLFAARGYGDVGTEEVVKASGLSRGALYHHFTDKSELFAAVYEAVEADVIKRIASTIANADQSDPIALLCLGASSWLDACGEPEIHQIALLDAPAVLGLSRWREISTRYGIGLAEGLLARAIEVGRIPHQPITPLAHILLGALREGALYLAGATDPIKARREVGAVIDEMIRSLA